MPLETILRKSGMVGMLVELSEGDKTFTQIREALRLSMTTVLTRLREAEAYELIERNVGTTGRSRIEVKYKLAPKGEKLIKNLLENERLSGLIEKCRNLKKRTYEVENELLELMNETDIGRYTS